jgi:uncharacterized protein (TIGR00369 family)
MSDAQASGFRRSDAEWLARFRAKGPPPGATSFLGFEMLAIDQAARRIEAAFTSTPQMHNPLGQIQGGMLTAMLDECMSVAAIIALDFRSVVPTLEIKTSYLRPAKPGRILGEGRVVRLGRSIAFLEGALRDPEGELLATATATAVIAPRPDQR